MGKANYKSSIYMHSYAKINLSLDVIGKGPNGYHKLCMIMQTVSLRDDVRIIRTMEPGVINLYCPNRYVPNNKKNIAYKAAKLIFDTFPSETSGFGLNISIIKRIPIAGGLAGGSGNAAAVIKAMNEMFKLSMSHDKMCSLGVQIGADVPYCIHGGTMLSEGIGEILTPLTPFPKSIILLVNPRKPLSTADVFSSINDISSLPHANIGILLEALEAGDTEAFMKNTVNSLEVPSFTIMPEIADIKMFLIKKGAKGALMSGSGPTVFALFKDEAAAKSAASYLTAKGYRSFITRTIQPS